MKNLDSLARPNLANAGVNYNDLNSLNSIKQAGRAKDPESLRKVAQQFEAMFVQTMLKTMRQTNEVFGKDNFLNSNETSMYQGMLDDQMSLSLTSGRGLGLADAFFDQMSRQYGFGNNGSATAEGGRNMISNASIGELSTSRQSPINGELSAANQFEGALNWQSMTAGSAYEGIDLQAMRAKMIQAAEARQAFIQAGEQKSQSLQGEGITQSMASSIQDFIDQLTPAAKRIANYLGIDPKGIIAQAALETGWGQHVIQDEKGQSSFNLFNIKAKAGEPSVAVDTQEFYDGKSVREQAEFRKYSNYHESFSDYARLLKDNQRYQEVLSSGSDSNKFAEQLQQSGYATDPKYADKIKQILQRQEFDALD